ncbi:hypothetical protein BCR44DRAFT_1429841 [Catenaria anguillulae PL171]|uniref:Uncharacterized protein n=1 Tax=Catenaria anguillulae PL171 TaxID=765915 RepID=A0A1Y2HSY5_9FUNG|nr:hypothetical protein BCR44DRAFT_1429841 [Catenaria anguillulae PL171]
MADSIRNGVSSTGAPVNTVNTVTQPNMCPCGRGCNQRSRPDLQQKGPLLPSPPHMISSGNHSSNDSESISERSPAFPYSPHQTKINNLASFLAKAREDSVERELAHERNEQLFQDTLLSEPSGIVQFTHTVTTLDDLGQDQELAQLGRCFVVDDPSRPASVGLNPPRLFFVNTREHKLSDPAGSQKAPLLSKIADAACQALTVALDWIFPAVEHPEMARALAVSSVALQLRRTRKRIEEGRTLMLETEKLLEDMLQADAANAPKGA